MEIAQVSERTEIQGKPDEVQSSFAHPMLPLGRCPVHCSPPQMFHGGKESMI